MDILSEDVHVVSDFSCILDSTVNTHYTCMYIIAAIEKYNAYYIIYLLISCQLYVYLLLAAQYTEKQEVVRLII